jgi:hypothetical protein
MARCTEAEAAAARDTSVEVTADLAGTVLWTLMEFMLETKP